VVTTDLVTVGTCSVKSGSLCSLQMTIRIEKNMLSRKIQVTIRSDEASGIHFGHLCKPTTPFTFGSNYGTPTTPDIILRSSTGSNHVN
jgi:hypothetical protein